MINLERLCLEQQTTISKQNKLIGELLEELLMFRALSEEEKRLALLAEKGEDPDD